MTWPTLRAGSRRERLRVITGVRDGVGERLLVERVRVVGERRRAVDLVGSGIDRGVDRRTGGGIGDGGGDRVAGRVALEAPGCRRTPGAARRTPSGSSFAPAFCSAAITLRISAAFCASAAFAVAAWVCTPNDRLARVGVDVAVPVPLTVIVRTGASAEPAACEPSGRATPATAAAPSSRQATMSMRFMESSVRCRRRRYAAEAATSQAARVRADRPRGCRR